MVIQKADNGTDSQNSNAKNEVNPPKRKPKRSKDSLTDHELRQVDKIEKFMANHLSNEPRHLKELGPILGLVLGFVRIFLAENVFRYLLGILAYHTDLTIRNVAECAKCSPKVVQTGRQEVVRRTPLDVRRKRKKGGGKKRSPDYERNRKEIIKFVRLRSYGPCTKGMQEYTAVTISGICEFMQRKYGVKISRSQIHCILHDANIRLRKNKKLLYGNQKTETDEMRAIRHLQFDLIAEVLEKEVNNPFSIVLSVDTKKTENLGPWAAPKPMWSMGEEAINSPDHDFLKVLEVKTLKGMDDLLQRQEGKAIPQGIYDIGMKKAYIGIGISHDTSEFACCTINRFFSKIKADHPQAKKLILLCDGGGSYNARGFQFKLHALKLSNEIGMPIHVYHYPPYRSKFNPIERHVFAPLSFQYQHAQLTDIRTILALTNSTKTSTGLTVQAELDPHVYATGQKTTDEQKQFVNRHITYVKSDHIAENKLSYTLNGVHVTESGLPSWAAPTVFNIKENFDMSREQKLQLKKQKAEAKKARAKAKEKKDQAGKSRTERKSRKHPKTTGGSTSKGEKSDRPAVTPKQKATAI